MIALIQRVTNAAVSIDGRQAGAIGAGVLALIGVRREDDEASAARLLERVLSYRIFADEAGRMNRSLPEVAGALLLVPQFTLAADTHKGTRAGFSRAAEPAVAQRLFEHLLALAHARHSPVAAGAFGAHMQIALVNDGPVTFWLETSAKDARE
jgi:D-aminoacyl-tRNA deacylase